MGKKELRHDEVPMAVIIDYLTRDAKKVRNYTFLPIFVIFMFALVTMMFGDRIDWTLHTSEYFTLKQATYDISSRTTVKPDPDSPTGRTNFDGVISDFTQISQRKDFYPWLDKFVTSVYELSTMEYQSSLLPIDLILIRQIRAARGSADECWDRTNWIIDPYTLKNVIGTGACYLVETEFEPKAFIGGEGEAGSNVVRNISWVPNNIKAVTGVPVIRGRNLIGKFHSMDDVDIEYSEACYLEGGSLTECLELVKKLEEGNFFDGGVQMISVDVFSYFPNQQQYLGISHMIDVSPSGFLAPEVTGSVFRVYSTTVTMHLVLLVGDVVIVLFAITLLFITTKEVMEAARLLPHKSIPKWKAFAFWDLLTYTLAILLFVLCVNRFRLWGVGAQSLTRQEDTETNMRTGARVAFELYAEIDTLYIFVYELMSFCFLVCGIKFFYFLQYVQGLNVVTSTIRHCVKNLIALGLLFVGMLFIYAIIGNVLFGQMSGTLRTVPLAATFLIRCIIAGQIYGYATFAAYNSFATYIFFGSMYIFFWLLIVNLVLGAISSAFLSFDRLNDADPLGEVLKTYFLLRGDIFLAPKHMSHIEDKLMSACVRAASEPMRFPDSFVNRLKFLIEKRREKVAAAETLIDEFSKFRDPDDAILTRESFAELLPDMPNRDRERVFDMALQVQKSQIQTGLHAEKQHEKVVKELGSIDRLAQKAHDMWRKEQTSKDHAQRRLQRLEEKLEREKEKRTELKEKFRSERRNGGGRSRRNNGGGSDTQSVSSRVRRRHSVRSGAESDAGSLFGSSSSSALSTEITATPDAEEDDIGEVPNTSFFAGGGLDALAQMKKDQKMGLNLSLAQTQQRQQTAREVSVAHLDAEKELASKKGGGKGAAGGRALRSTSPNEGGPLRDPEAIDDFVDGLFGGGGLNTSGGHRAGRSNRLGAGNGAGNVRSDSGSGMFQTRSSSSGQPSPAVRPQRMSAAEVDAHLDALGL